MATKKIKEEGNVLDEQLGKSEAFIEKNLKKIGIVLGAIIVVGVGIFIYNNHLNSVEEQAVKDAYPAEQAFAAGQGETALKGQGAQMKGLQTIINQYGGTKTANVARLMAGVELFNEGKIDEAIRQFEAYKDADDMIVSPLATAALGNCYVTKGDKSKGVGLLLKAAEKADKRADEGKNYSVSPIFLLQAGEVYESMNQADKALELYKKIKSDYLLSALTQSGEIDKYIQRLTK